MHNKDNITQIIFYSVSFFIFGFLSFGTLIHWDALQKTFYDIKITDISQLILVLIIGYYISYYINIKSNKSIRVIEAHYNLFVSLEKLSDKIKTIHDDRLLNSTEENNKILISAIKKFSVQLSMIQEITSETCFDVCKVPMGKIEQRYFELKKLLTGGDFGAPAGRLSRSDVLRIDELFGRMFSNIKKAQIECYM